MSVFTNIGITDFYIHKCGNIKFNKSDFTNLYLDNNLVFIYIIEGYLESRDKIYNKNTLFIIKERNFLKVKGKAEIYYFSIFGENIAENLGEINEYFIEDYHNCKYFFEKILLYYEDLNKSLYVTSMVYRILDLILTSYNEYNNDKLCVLIKNHITKHKNCTRKELVDIIGYSADYLERVFKKEYKMSITQYKNKLKCEMAKSYLSNTKEKIADISKLCEFSSENQFRKVFFNLVGKTPKDYRKEQIIIKMRENHDR